MIKKSCSTNRSLIKEDSSASPAKKGCRAFHKLKEWQIRKYRKAVDENKWYMGEQRGKEVHWQEAEQDFLQNEYYGCAPKWRSEYCGALCNHSRNCTLGEHFTRKVR